MVIHYHMSGSNNTPVTEANIRRATQERADERGIKITFTSSYTAEVEIETPRQLRERMDRDEAIRVFRAGEATLQYVFNSAVWEI